MVLIGDLLLRNERGMLKGTGTIHGVAVSLTGRRPAVRAANAPRVHDFKAATSGLTRWMARHYKLNDSEIATVLTNAIEYDIAEVVDPHTHVVAKIPKLILKQLPKP